jgi:hypothetical protein
MLRARTKKGRLRVSRTFTERKRVIKATMPRREIEADKRCARSFATSYFSLLGSYQTASILLPSGSMTKAAKYPGE